MRHVAYCGTREIYDDMETAAKSLVRNGNVDRVHFVIEDARFPRPLPSIIECHDMSRQCFFTRNGPNMTSGYTYMAMMRIALCHVLPDADKVLALDCDTITTRDLSELWDLPIDDCYLSAVPEWHRSRDGLQYCNFGVVLYNLEKMRDGKADECIDVLNRRKYTWVEQCVGNYLCQGRIYEMPPEYNANHWTIKDFFNLSHQSRKALARVVHYAGIRDFRGYEEWREYESMSWDEVLDG